MGFWKKTGALLGNVTGTVVGGTVKVAGKATGSAFLVEVGEGVHKATKASGELLGDVVEGSVVVAGGVLASDGERLKEGLGQVGSAAGDTALRVGSVLGVAAQNGEQVIDGLLNDDPERARRAARELAKTAAVAVLSVGVVDVLVDVDAAAPDVDGGAPDVLADGVEPVVATGDAPGLHHVDAHAVEGYVRSDGAAVDGYWRDGDGNTSIDRTTDTGGGYWRSNPDGDPTNNLG